MPRLILIRHGETDWNIEGRYQGQADPPINAKGREQALQLARSMRGVEIELLYSSPLRRALETAEILAAQLDLPIEIDARLQEIHQGDWQTRLRREIQALYPELFRRWESEPWQVSPPGGESLEQVQHRVHAAVDEILRRRHEQPVVLVSHRIPLVLLKLRYQDLDPDCVRTLHVPNAGWEELAVPLPAETRTPAPGS